MIEDIAPTDRPRKNRGKVVAAVATVSLLGVCAAAGLAYAVDWPAKGGSSASLAELRPSATAEQAYALSLPVLESWLEEDFKNSWIVVSSTLEHAARALDAAADQPADYAVWAPRFERVVSLADAVAKGDKAAAKAALEPLLAEEPGPYADTAVDPTLSVAPYADAEASLVKLDAAIAAQERGAARKAVADTAAALAEVALTAQVELSADSAPEVLERLLPAFHAIDDVHDAVLHGHASDAEAAVTKLHSELAAFRSWQLSLSP
ncbi:hypothetical protein AOC05_09090 [Arthrobacter alpinus]|uniref:Uncharacterized protein n=1 Tax=Arthrobacter alpinus TaxID=656366 RepID=A0A0M4RBN3_9MICC|nr:MULTISPECIES: hypothetical protein [Arthrobacter]ALE92431.1 hypothetical protein AOC05_09090 [Arthrobacter alpinus]